MEPSEAARWQHLKALFNEAVDLDAEARLAFLDHVDDASLRDELADLLAAYDETEALGRFETPVLRAPDTSVAAGTRLGPYRIVEEVGRGGMGAVYWAERADGQFEQTVALKLLPPGLGSADVAERFRAERQILARLEHPHVARLLDGGVTSTGPFGGETPWLAMEFVRGEPITDYVERQGLSIEARIRLFTQVCEAVAYAHRNLVVHRDLKPSNILVAETDRGVPQVKLLDFGIAKLMEDEGTGVALTRTGLRPMTPQYAAPEQVRGEPVTTATDVYGLGVVLYEVLTGHRPYDVADQSPSEIERTVCETEPARPSAVVQRNDRAAEAQRLAGDLDTIVLKALAKEPERRYASAEALADDLRRHLDGQPVLARPATAGYRTRKFVQRHRAGVAATALVALALVAATGVSLWQAGIAAAERDRTAAALVQAEGTLDFLENTILMGDPQQGDPDAPLSAVLDSAAARVDEAASPQVAGAIHTSLANVYLGRGLPERAEEHARRALATLDPDEPRAGWALIALGQALADAGRAADAEPYHVQSVALLREAGDEHRLATALNTYGATLFALGRHDEAEAAYREAFDIQRRLGDEVTTTLNNLTILLTEQGRAEESVDVLAEIVADYRRREGPQAAYGLGFALVNWAGALSNLGRAEEALIAYREGAAQFTDVLGPEHPEAIAGRISTAFHLHRMGRFDEARREAGAVLTVAEETLGEDHPYTAYAQNVAGTALCDGGAPERGASLLRASLTARRKMVPEDHWILANGESLLGGCLAQLGRSDEAEHLLRSGYEALRTALGDEHLKTAEARDRLHSFYATHDRSAEAARLVEGG